jgi:tRNA nucleotidyltransferase/poly(A) polymerase
MRSRKPLLNTLPLPLQDLLKSFKEARIPALLVGGLVRDFYLTGLWSTDIDLEVRCDDLTLQKFLRNNPRALDVEVLRFGVCRLRYDDLELEIAPARIEIYPPHQAPLGHSDFEVEYCLDQVSDEVAFSRRDFTINAMGLKLGQDNQLELIDPYHGLDDLEKGILELVHPAFHRDPVRLARAVRFSLKFSMEYSSKLIEAFTRMSLEMISVNLILREALKSGELKFFSELFILIEDCGVKASKELMLWSFMREFRVDQRFEDLNELWFALCFYSDEEIDYQLSEHQDLLIKSLQLKQKEAIKTLRLLRFMRQDFDEALLAINEVESLEDLKSEISSVLSLIKWANSAPFNSWMQKYSAEENSLKLVKINSLYDTFQASLLKIKSDHPDEPMLWDGLALKDALAK